MNYKIGLVGYPFDVNSLFGFLGSRENIIFKIIERIVGAKIEFSSVRYADLIVVFPYIQWTRSFMVRKKYAIQKAKIGMISNTDVLAEAMGIRGRRVLVIAPENLDRCHWEEFGSLLRISNLPRLTHWPTMLDPRGVRFPYWYNYVQWPEFPRDENCYRRYGRLYNIDKLMLPIPEESRTERAVIITSHEQFPRIEVLEQLKQKIKFIDVFGKNVRPFDCSKIDLLMRYKYCIATENSIGFGYCSEKIPEAWIAGCIPIGCIPQPFTDFNSEACILDNIDDQGPFIHPLLAKRPELTEIEIYLANAINLSIQD